MVYPDVCVAGDPPVASAISITVCFVFLFHFTSLLRPPFPLRCRLPSNHVQHRDMALTQLQIKEIVAHEVRSHILENTQLITKTVSATTFPPVKVLPDHLRLRILVTGGSGFVGSHLVDRLMMAGHHVIVLDNMFTGRQKNVAHWLGHPNFQLIIHDVVEPILLEVDQIYHLACPASPPHYQVRKRVA
jgi:hypothetical protein